MTKYSDFLTMKLIQRNRGRTNSLSNEEALHLLADTRVVKNLNVRTNISLIAQVEALSEALSVSKALLVTEMLEGALDEAIEKLKERDDFDDFMIRYFKVMEKDYGYALKYDEDGRPIEIDLENSHKEST